MNKAPITAVAVVALLALTGCDTQTGPADEAEPEEVTESAPPVLDSDTGPSDEDVEDLDDDEVADAPAEDEESD
ncbi:hypothetical protein [Nesterenkonia lutea]|uniref:Lipoprotein NlpE involved in copper resistance n=1 Tax=Nesterenkonia lutea TaxID=272919 RepID=A0ABR9JBP0_9MICC|nr:hypothetical protein [Nesterenkonia lutea]MBE1523345.1 putative lipoprotein NlpE involved in copper resistance [Nesterenkonia lutea]